MPDSTPNTWPEHADATSKAVVVGVAGESQHGDAVETSELDQSALGVSEPTFPRPRFTLRTLLSAWGASSGSVFDGRARTLGLSGLRIVLLAVTSAVLATTLASALLWGHLNAEARREAIRALRFVEIRMLDIETEMLRLGEGASAFASWSDCRPDLTRLLTRASITSTLVKRYEVMGANEANSCRPEGRAIAPLLAHTPSGRLALNSTGEISTRVTATLRFDSIGRNISAVLDARAFEPKQHDHDSWLYASTSHLTLMSRDGNPLAVLGNDDDTDASPPVLQAAQTSSRFDVMVVANIKRPRFVAATRRWAGAAIGVTWLLLLVGVVLTWRRALVRTRLYHRIARGLRRREFEPFVQPIMDLRTGQCAGAEILMRWAHPQRGIVGPAEFIEEAERTGLIVGMSDLVMTRAAHRLAPIAARYPDLYFSFNLTPLQLALPTLPQRLDEIFTSETIARDRVLLELTEREFIDPLALNSIHTLQRNGWRVAIDDFGTGHSSLAALERMTIDRLKIDRAFVSTIRDETVSRPVLDSIIDLADRLQLPMIAEGLETQAQWDYLADRGVQYAQGFLIGRPMPIAAFVEWLARQDQHTPSSVPAVVSGVVGETHVPDVAAQRLWNALRTPGGLDIRDRMFRLRTYANCFVGREAVDWLVQNQRVSRAEAVRMGQHLSALGLLSHVVDEHDFEDAELFYRLATPRDAGLALGPSAVGLSAQMRSAQGVPIGQHTRGLLRHGDCATGKTVVTWIAASLRVSRDTATRLALQLMREGAIRHVYDDKPFTDSRDLYRIA
jgi:EAL domain-containing protein (putative c-di-GMP-specific phosphodiesterase class I)